MLYFDKSGKMISRQRIVQKSLLIPRWISTKLVWLSTKSYYWHLWVAYEQK